MSGQRLGPCSDIELTQGELLCALYVVQDHLVISYSLCILYPDTRSVHRLFWIHIDRGE